VCSFVVSVNVCLQTDTVLVEKDTCEDVVTGPNRPRTVHVCPEGRFDGRSGNCTAGCHRDDIIIRRIKIVAIRVRYAGYRGYIQTTKGKQKQNRREKNQHNEIAQTAAHMSRRRRNVVARICRYVLYARVCMYKYRVDRKGEKERETEIVGGVRRMAPPSPVDLCSGVGESSRFSLAFLLPRRRYSTF